MIHNHDEIYRNLRPLPESRGALASQVEGYLFLAVVFIEAFLYYCLIHEHRIIAGHDGFANFTVQYCFLSNAISSGEIAQWSPFMMHGTPATMGYLVTCGIIQNILLLTSGLFQNVNFLPLFYIGFFIDQLLLIVGVWLLGRRFFSSPLTIFFVTMSISASSIWFLQPSFNFHSYYCVPFMLYLVHLFFDEGKWRYIFLAGNLLFIQSFNNPPYFLPFISLVLLLYFLFYFLSTPYNLKRKIRTIRLGWSFLLTLFLVVVSFIALYAVLSIATQQLVNYGSRSQGGVVPLDVFLSYGGKFSWYRWLELFVGISPCVDYTLYIGIFGPPLILLGIVHNLTKQNIHFILTIIVVLLFSMGTFVSVFFYYSWPMMKYFRHLLAVFPVIKMFLCFLSGFGLDALILNKSFQGNLFIKKITFAVLFFCMFCLFISLLNLSDTHEVFRSLIHKMVPENAPPIFLPLFNMSLASFLIKRTALFALPASIIFLALSFCNKRRIIMMLVVLLLIVHVADIYGFSFLEMKLKTIPLNDEMYSITEFQPMPYVEKRDISFWANNPRAKLMKILPEIVDWGSYYWTINAFLFKDQLGSPFRTDFWMQPLDKYMKAYCGQDINDVSIEPKGLFHRTEGEFARLEFPIQHPAALKISGVTEDKIQFFSQVEFLSSEDEIVEEITDSNYKGDIIFLSPSSSDVKEKGSYKEKKDRPPIDLSESSRLYLPYKVLRFDANNLVVTTEVDDMSSAWLFYSDVWHPCWKATVNGNEVPVYKANLAYKAVKLGKGFNKVHFYFKWRFMPFFNYFVGLNALFWVVVIAFLTGKIFFGGSRTTGNNKKIPASVN